MATLTTVKGANKTLVDAGSQIDLAANRGKIRRLYDSYTVDAADEIGTSGLIRCFTIPKGATLVDARVVCPATGATGIFDIGWAASEEEDSSGTALEAADADGIFSQIDPGAAAVDSRMSGTVAGYNKQFAADVEVQIDCTEITADMGTKTIHLEVFIIDLA